MPITIEQFKKAFANKRSDDGLEQREKLVAAGLKRLKSAIDEAAGSDRFKQELVELVAQFKSAKQRTEGRAGKLDGILRLTDSLIDRIQSAAGKGGAGAQATTPSPKTAGAKTGGTAVQGPGGSGLAGQIRAAISAGGINIAMYMIGDPDSNNDREFARQALRWAGNHGAFGLSGSNVRKDHAMSLSQDPGKLVSDLLTAIKRELGSNETIPIANVALFCHGGQRSAQIDSRGADGGEGWARSASNVVKGFAAAVKPALTGGAKIHLYACSTAKDRDPTKDHDDPTRIDSFAEDLQEMTGAEVWGHEDARHTTGNPLLVQVTDSDQDTNAERYQIRDVLARKFLRHVDASLTEPQMGYLDQTLEISRWIKDSLIFKKEEGASRRERVQQLDRHQTFIEEISMMGYEELFDLLIGNSPPNAATFRSLFPEHDQIDTLVEGAALVHAKFHRDIDAKRAAIAAARRNPGFPAAG